MVKHICSKCNNLIYETDNDLNTTLKGICFKCNMSPTDKQRFFDAVNKDANSFRSRKIKEILDKMNPSETEKMMLDFWAKNNLT
jgi:DNA-directed RNA polymerase subunit M/transcription elongation factor TFIIS